MECVYCVSSHRFLAVCTRPSLRAMVWDRVKRYASPPEAVLEAAEQQAKELAEREGLENATSLERLREQVTYIAILSSLDVRGWGLRRQVGDLPFAHSFRAPAPTSSLWSTADARWRCLTAERTRPRRCWA